MCDVASFLKAKGFLFSILIVLYSHTTFSCVIASFLKAKGLLLRSFKEFEGFQFILMLSYIPMQQSRVLLLLPSWIKSPL